MTHPIIKTENYLLVVGDKYKSNSFPYVVAEKTKTGEFCLCRLNQKFQSCQMFQTYHLSHLYHLCQNYHLWQVDNENDWDDENQFAIVAHLPLNNATTLDGVPLLPPIEDEDISNLTFQAYKEQEKWTWGEFKDIFPAGYNKAKEKYKFTKEDLYMLAAKVVNDIAKNKGNTDWNMFTTPKMIAEEFIQQPKYPVAFECEIDNILSYNADDGINALINLNFGNPKTITNSQGLTELVGRYIYES
jgi:hypothetical protein